MDVYKMDAQVGLKTITITLILFLNLFFYFLPAAALCHDFSFVICWAVLKHKMPSQILIKNSLIGQSKVKPLK